MKKHGTKKSHNSRKSRHHRLVGGVLAAALAFTVAVGSQVGDFDGGQLKADFMCNGAMVPDGTACQPMDGGGGGYVAPPAGGGYVAPTMTTCPDGSQVAQGTNCPVAAPTGGYVAPTGGTACASGQWMCGNGQCSVNNVCPTTGGYVAPTGGFTGGAYPAGTCQNGTAYPAGSGYPPCGSSTGSMGYTGYTGGTVDTIGACQGRGGTWSAATSTCSVGSTSATGMTTAQMQAGCVAAQGTWDATRNFCQMPGMNTTGMYGSGMQNTTGMYGSGMQNTTGMYGSGMQNTTGMYGSGMQNTTGMYGSGQYGMDSASTRTFWCMSLGKMATATECDASDTTSGFQPSMPPFNPGMMQQCQQGEYFDFQMQSCKQMKTEFNNFNTSEHFDVFQGGFECPEWDAYCQSKMTDGGFGEEGFGFEEDFSEVQCLKNPKDITRMQKEIARDVAQIEKRFQEVDLSQLSDSYATAEIKSSFDTLKGLSTSTDGCDIAKAGEYRGKFFGGPEGEGYMMQLNSVGELARFRKELGRISQEIAKEKTRMKGDALVYLTEAETLVAELGANPSFDIEQPWTLWAQLDPECMRGGMGGPGMGGPGMGGPEMGGPEMGGPEMGGSRGGRGMPQFNCTDDELKTTPRGLMMLARKTADSSRHEDFAGGICEEAEGGLGEAEDFLLPQLTGSAKTEAEKLIQSGKQIVAKCKADKDPVKYASVFDKMQSRFMAIVEDSGIDFEDFEGGEDEDFNMDDFSFANTDELVGSDIMDKINALLEAKFAELESKFEEKLNNVQRLFEEKLTQMASVFSQTVIDSLASVVDMLDEDVANDLAAVTEFSTFIVDEDAQEVANAKVEATVDAIEQTETIKQLAEGEDNEDLVELVNEFQAKLAEDPLPLSVVTEAQDIIESALTVAENGGDATDKLEEVIELIDNVSIEETQDALLLSGEWNMADVAPTTDLWYAREFADAMSKGVLGGTPTEVVIDGQTVEATNMRPGVALNNCEGTAMAIKTYNSAVGEDLPEASADAVRLAGDSTWCAPFIQAYMDIAGKGDTETLFANGGASAEMNREDVAIMMTELYEDVAGPMDVSPENTYANAWSDADSISGATAEHAFAVQYELGVLTGGNGGTVGQADVTITRDQAAKVFSVGFDKIQEGSILGESGSSIIDPLFMIDPSFMDVEGASIGGPEPTEPVPEI